MKPKTLPRPDFDRHHDTMEGTTMAIFSWWFNFGDLQGFIGDMTGGLR